MSSAGYHEAVEELTDATRDMPRALLARNRDAVLSKQLKAFLFSDQPIAHG